MPQATCRRYTLLHNVVVDNRLKPRRVELEMDRVQMLQNLDPDQPTLHAGLPRNLAHHKLQAML